MFIKTLFPIQHLVSKTKIVVKLPLRTMALHFSESAKRVYTLKMVKSLWWRTLSWNITTILLWNLYYCILRLAVTWVTRVIPKRQWNMMPCHKLFHTLIALKTLKPFSAVLRITPGICACQWSSLISFWP